MTCRGDERPAIDTSYQKHLIRCITFARTERSNELGRLMPDRDAFRTSVLARPVGVRLVGAALLIALLWAAIVWAVALP